MLKFGGSLIVVEEMTRARQFYEGLLGQAVVFDFGENVSYEGFSLHNRAHFQSLLAEESGRPVIPQAHWGELFFEADDLEPIYQRLSEAGVAFIHPIIEQPWAQRVLRVYDPDGHIVEIGERMDAVILRLKGEGLPVQQISEKTGMPADYIESVLEAGTASD